MSTKNVLSLGQCGTDHASISRLLRSHFGAEVTAAHTFELSTFCDRWFLASWSGAGYTGSFRGPLSKPGLRP